MAKVNKPSQSPPAESELVSRAKSGDIPARNALIERYAPGIALLARQYLRPRSSVEQGDLVSEGVLGLIHALDRFDPKAGASFRTYSKIWIHYYMDRATCRGEVLVSPNARAGRRARRGAVRGDPLFRALVGQQYSPVADDDSCDDGDDSVGTTAPSVVDRAWVGRRGIQIADSGLDPEEETAAKEEREAAQAVIEECLRVLDDTEAAVVRVRWLGRNTRTIDETADVLHLSSGRVKTLERSAFEKIRSYLDKEYG